MSKILITGGTGYIGSHVALAFLEAGCDVALLDNLCNSGPDVAERIAAYVQKTVDFFEIDVRDRAALDGLFSAHKCDGVVHCAGLKAVGESVEFPLKYYDNNVAGTVCLLQAMEQAGVSNIVFSSSATVYGEPHYLPFDENHPLNPESPYGNSKLMVENILTDIEECEWPLRSAILRYFNPAGAHKSGQFGESPKGIPANLVPFVSQAAAGIRDEIKVWGDDYDTPDGTGVRDYIHIDDLAQAHLKAYKYLEANRKSLIANIGTGVGFSVLDVINCFSEVIGRNINTKICDRRPGDVAAFYANAELASKLMGWNAKYGLKDMCEDQWKWERSNGNN